MKRLSHKDLLNVDEYSEAELFRILALAAKLKKKNNKLLKDKTLGMIFEKSSTRTRVSFEVGMYQLGGNALFLSRDDIQLGRGESIKDTAQVLSRYLNGIMIRAYAHESVVELAKYSTIPVINGLTDLYHPCQALSDFFTIWEYKKQFKNIKVSFIGDGNNMANSLLLTAVIFGSNFSIASPKGYQIPKEIEEKARLLAKKSNAEIILTDDPKQAAKNADILYTDVWVSMGQEEEKEKRMKAFQGYTIDNNLVALAKKDVKIMHCLPAHRGEEISSEVLDGPQSIIIDQAENRMHVQKSILALLLG